MAADSSDEIVLKSSASRSVVVTVTSILAIRAPGPWSSPTDRRPEVTGDAIFQVFRFSDVKQTPLCIKHLIDPRTGRQLGEVRLGVKGTHTQLGLRRPSRRADDSRLDLKGDSIGLEHTVVNRLGHG